MNVTKIMLIKQSGNMEVYINALRSNLSWILLCLRLYLGTWLKFFYDSCFADKDREGESHRDCNGIHSHYLSVHRPSSQDNDLNILLVCFYLSRFCSVLIVSARYFNYLCISRHLWAPILVLNISLITDICAFII